MKIDATVIMGCYNSTSTLIEALDSVLSQSFNGAFEVIAVDDGSTDSTLQILKEKARADHRLHVVEHTQNRGGGAARNSAISASHGPYVLDFDSDNVLGEGALQKMFSFLSEHEDLHGALFQEQRIFQGRDRRKYNPYRYYTETAPLELAALFQGRNAEFGNLMCRREAYDMAGGYPEHHGFDTQGFCIRFLSRGLRAQVAPGSYYWHRTSGPEASYFERVFATGRFNINIYLTYEDMIEQFTDEALDTILKSQIFRVRGFDPDSIGARLKSLELSGAPVLRTRDHDADVRRGPFVRGVVALRERRYEDSLHAFLELARTGVSTPILHFNVIRCVLGISGMEPARLVDEALAAARQLRTRSLPVTRRWSLLNRGLVKAARLVLSAHGFEDPVS